MFFYLMSLTAWKTCPSWYTWILHGALSFLSRSQNKSSFFFSCCHSLIHCGLKTWFVPMFAMCLTGLLGVASQNAPLNLYHRRKEKRSTFPVGQNIIWRICCRIRVASVLMELWHTVVSDVRNFMFIGPKVASKPRKSWKHAWPGFFLLWTVQLFWMMPNIISVLRVDRIFRMVFPENLLHLT